MFNQKITLKHLMPQRRKCRQNKVDDDFNDTNGQELFFIIPAAVLRSSFVASQSLQRRYYY